MPPRHESPSTARIVGALLASVWMAAGIVAVFFGARAHRWLLVALGLAAIWYGLIWVGVARQGRRMTVRQALTPWRLGR